VAWSVSPYCACSAPPGASAEIVGEGHALLAQGLQLLAPLGDDLVLIYGKPFGGGRGGGRGSVRS
jgi:hypothetical protein